MSKDDKMQPLTDQELEHYRAIAYGHGDYRSTVDDWWQMKAVRPLFEAYEALLTQLNALDESLHSSCTLAEDHPTLVLLEAIQAKVGELERARLNDSEHWQRDQRRIDTLQRKVERLEAALREPHACHPDECCLELVREALKDQ